MCIFDNFPEYLAPPSTASSSDHSHHNSYNSTHSYESYSMMPHVGSTFTGGYDTLRSRSGTLKSNGTAAARGDEGGGGGGTLKRTHERKYSSSKLFYNIYLALQLIYEYMTLVKVKLTGIIHEISFLVYLQNSYKF